MTSSYISPVSAFLLAASPSITPFRCIIGAEPFSSPVIPSSARAAIPVVAVTSRSSVLPVVIRVGSVS